MTAKLRTHYSFHRVGWRNGTWVSSPAQRAIVACATARAVRRTNPPVPGGDPTLGVISLDGEAERSNVPIVARLVEQLHGRSASFRVNGKFIGLGAGTQEYMIRQIFREQRDLQQRGVI